VCVCVYLHDVDRTAAYRLEQRNSNAAAGD
jgi:hypothetical protein